MIKCKVIAELGYNFCGDLSLARKMIIAAKSSGVDIIKTQIWSVKNLRPGKWDFDGRKDIYKKSELTPYQISQLIDICNENEIEFLVSVFNEDDLCKLPLNYKNSIKIPSTEITNIPLLKKCRERFDELILSTGSSTMEEIDFAYNICQPCHILHCTNIYPCPDDKINLLKINLLKQIYPSVGFSDHTVGISAPLYAISHGCSYLEKHFTIDNSLPGRDNAFSATPEIMKQICDARDLIYKMASKLTIGYQDEEEEMRNCYRMRWCGSCQ